MLLIKLHALLALLSGFGFMARAMGHVRAQAWVQQKWVRILPHIVDTGLLVTAIMILVHLEISPFTDWVLAKIIALLVYIFLGVMALRIAKTPAKKMGYAIAAMVVFVYILAVAKSHDVWLGFMSVSA